MSADALLASDAPLNCHLLSGCGFPSPGVDIFDFPSLWTFHLLSITFEITKPTILLALCVIALVSFFIVAFRKATVVPRGIQNVAEYGYLFIRDGIARDTIGKAGDRYVPFLFSLFFLVFVFNFTGIVPFAQFPVSSQFAIPVAFAVLVYLVWVPLGMMKQGPGNFLKSMTMPPDVPWPMYFLLIPIEVVSNFLVRPFTHSVRLFANMFAGHLLIVTFSAATWYLVSPSIVGILGAGASFIVTIMLTVFELLIEALQAYVFTLLAAVYINDALHAHQDS